MAVVLIVEDEAFTRDLAELLIQDFGHQTLVACDVGEAITLLKSQQTIDALFTDIYLKAAVLGGCELAVRAVSLRPDIRVLYTTGNSITDAMMSMFVNGKHFLPKPYTPDQLQRSMEVMLAA